MLLDSVVQTAREEHTAYERALQWPATFAPATTAPSPSNMERPTDTASDVLPNAVGDVDNPDAGYALQYGDVCEKLYASSGAQLETISVSFDYEMTLSSQQPAPEGYTLLSWWMPALEWGTLWTAAQDLGLHGCAFEDDESFQSQIRPSVIVALSSLQTDRLDSTVGGATCQFLTSESGECYPMVGSMAAKFIGDNSTSTAVKDYLLSVIESQMNQDLVLTGAVESTLYLGDRQDYDNAQTPSPTVSPTLSLTPAPSAVQAAGEEPIVPLTTTRNTSDPTVILATSLSVAAAFVVITLFALLLLTRRNKKLDSSRKISILSEVDNLERAETGSSQHTDSQADEEKSPASSPQNAAGPLTLPDLLADTLADGSVITDGTVASGEVLSTGEVTVTNIGEATVVSESTGDSDEAIGENMDKQPMSNSDDKALELPPKPPQGPSKQPPPVQQTLAKRRRRKKRKKKKNQAIMPRVSSRENIKAMETISESNGEGVEECSDDEDYSDSEYSYETDESGSRSRDPSPIRSDGGSGEFRASAPL